MNLQKYRLPWPRYLKTTNPDFIGNDIYLAQNRDFIIKSKNQFMLTITINFM